MPSETNSSGSVRTSKPRSSIRHSLGLTSVGKALADVMNKESRDSEKSARKSKENSGTRRLSAINLVQPAPAHKSVTSETKAPSVRREGTPEQKNLTRNARRSSVIHKPPTPSDETGTLGDSTLPQTATNSPITRSASAPIRPRSAASSALPKYRQRSALREPGKKSSSPTRAGTRSSQSSPDEDKRDKKASTKRSTPEILSQKPPQKLSNSNDTSLHSKTAIKVNLTATTVTISPSTPPPKGKVATPSAKISPTRLQRGLKPVTNIPHSRSAAPQSSSSSSSSSGSPLTTPRTPRSPSLKHALGFKHSARSREPSPLGSYAPESPLSRQLRKNTSTPNANRLRPAGPNLSHVSEGNSVDSDEDAEDVELLLAPVAHIGAPTPAMPRVQVSRKRAPPQTPSRSGKTGTNSLPTRANISYLSPLPPDQDSPNSLRASRPKGSERGRGSILSWEQLAQEGSVQLEEAEMEKLLTDLPTPFRSGTVTPSPTSSHPGDLDSPLMGPAPSPGTFGSISQLILPDVTPSPAPHHQQLERFGNISVEPSIDASAVTLLRLQLASADDNAKKQVVQIQSLENELKAVRKMQQRETEQLGGQIKYLEDQLHGLIESRDRTNSERAAQVACLEEQLRSIHTHQEQLVTTAVSKAKKEAKTAHQTVVEREQRRWEMGCSARAAGASWVSVRDAAESELDVVQAGKEMLAVLLAGLDVQHMSLAQVVC